MIKEIIVKPKKLVKELIEAKQKLYDNWALISIWAQDRTLTQENAEVLKDLGCSNSISIRCHDITGTYRSAFYPEDEELFLFNETDAGFIIAFLDSIKDKVDTLMVHCAAGISRSGAVGLFACRYYGLDENTFRAQHPHIFPNIHILKTLNEVSGIDRNYMEFWDTEQSKSIRDRLDRVMTEKYLRRCATQTKK